MKIKNAWRALFGREEKTSKISPLLVSIVGSQPRATPRDYRQLAKEGYQQSIIAFRCIDLITRAAGKVPLYLCDAKSGKEIENHPLLDLLARPNPQQAGAKFIGAALGFYLISGNCYIEAIKAQGRPRELWTHRPDRVRVKPSAAGIPAAYIYTVGGQSLEWQVDQITGRSPDLLHIKTFNPLDDWYGMSPLEAAAFSVDQHSEAGKWNANILQNSGRPAGALIYKPEGDQVSTTLTPEQRNTLRTEIDNAIMGANAAGRPLLLDGGFDWKEMSISPKDMDWLQGKGVSATEIALAFHCPPQLVGVDGSLTFANFEQARLALYEDSVLPLLDDFLDELNAWLVPMFGENLRLKYDEDEISALAPRRKERWDAINAAGDLTINEKREARGYEPIDGGDAVLVGAGLIPLETAVEPPDPAEAGKEAYGDPKNEQQD